MPFRKHPRLTEQEAQGRVILDVAAEYLMGIYKEHTRIQADKLIEAYIGKWLPFSGTVANISSLSGASVVVYLRYAKCIVGAIFEGQGTDRVVTLRKFTKIGVLGKIKNVDSDEMCLEKCELIKLDI